MCVMCCSAGGMDYSGFNRATWPIRTGATHRQAAILLQNFVTKAEQARRESASGCRYSVLLRLPYFDAPRMLTVDPMHNLFIGTAKHVLKSIWMETGIVTSHNLDMIQRRVDAAVGIGRIPYKVASGHGFASFTADQWRNWVNYFLTYCTTRCSGGG